MSQKIYEYHLSLYFICHTFVQRNVCCLSRITISDGAKNVSVKHVSEEEDAKNLRWQSHVYHINLIRERLFYFFFLRLPLILI